MPCKNISLNGVKIPLYVPSVKPTLLWSQSVVSTTAKTISSAECLESPADFEWFLCRICYSNSDESGGYFIVRKNVRTSGSIVGIGSTHYAYTRRVTITDTSIAWENGYRNGTAGGTYAIPLEVWGLF